MDNIQLMSLFRQMASRKLSISLINVYKGFPIAYPATITEVSQDAIVVKTEAFQIVCLHHDRVTHIQSDYHPIMKASVDKVDFVKTKAVLFDFEIVKGNIGKRTQVRVAPADPIPGMLHRSGEEITFIGELADISLDGIGFYLAKEDYTSGVFQEGTKLAIFLKLPIQDVIVPSSSEMLPEYVPLQVRYDDIRERTDIPHRLEETPPIWGAETARKGKLSSEFMIEGVIVNLEEEKYSNRYRFGIHLLPGGPSRTVISKFIVQRQSEIIREVKSLYEMLVRAAADEAERKQK